jgi:hypothetical protein
VTEDEVETLLRETFRSREHLAAGGQHALLARMPRSPHPRRRLLVPAVAVATITAVAAVGIAVTLLDRGRQGNRPPIGHPADGGAPAGWVWYSSLGMEIAVPGDWVINDAGCHQSSRPSVVLGLRLYPGCYTPEPPDKRIALISDGPDDLTSGTSREIELDGIPATLTEGRLPDGRYTAELALPSRDVYLKVLSTDEHERELIIGTARLVDVDRLGCPTERPAVTAPLRAPADLVPDTVTSVSVCYYSGQPGARLQGSGELSAADAAWMIGAISAAPPGHNPDDPDCLQQDSVVPDAVLRFVEPNGQTSLLWVTWSSCVDRGLTNGVREVQVGRRLVQRMVAVLYPGIGGNDWSGEYGP